VFGRFLPSAVAAVALASSTAGGVNAVPPHVGPSGSWLPATVAKTCATGYVHATLSWGEKCLRAGEFCKIGNPEYHAYGFDCPADGLLVSSSTSRLGATSSGPVGATSGAIALGRAVLVGPRRGTSGCRRGTEPDPRCSPGAYYTGLTRAVICSATFRTSTIRNVPQTEKFAVEREYGLPARYYGYSIEIDHIVSLELGGSNNIANLFPEPGSGIANYHVKDRLENRVHDLVCAGTISLRSAQRQIALDWESLYRRVFGSPPD
jgi:hypothetical protein